MNKLRYHMISVLLIILLGLPKIGWTTCLGLGCSCVISATAVNFGSYNPFSASPNDSTGTASVTCSALVLGLLVAYNIQLSTGGSGSFVARTMASGSNHLTYNIYTDVARSQIWGSGSGGTSNVSDSFLLAISPLTNNYTMYGRIPASQNARPGSYSDSITATVTF